MVVMFFSFIIIGLQFVTYKIYVFVTTFGQFVFRRVIPNEATAEPEFDAEPEDEVEPEYADMSVNEDDT